MHTVLCSLDGIDLGCEGRGPTATTAAAAATGKARLSRVRASRIAWLIHAQASAHRVADYQQKGPVSATVISTLPALPPTFPFLHVTLPPARYLEKCSIACTAMLPFPLHPALSFLFLPVPPSVLGEFTFGTCRLV
jgi:hypothetical protein